MAADMIELECPSCSELLELDPGFAGGVCRCSSCGTLMTVPAKGGRDRAEALVRPDRPDAPGGAAVSRRPESPGEPARPQTPGATAASGAPRAPEAAPAEASPATAQTYVTTTGRVVTLDAHAPIPTAGKRKRAGVRIATIAAFCTLVIGVLAASVIAIVALSKGPSASSSPAVSTPSAHALHAFAFDSSANPLELEHPNVMGLPLSKTTAIVYDLPDAADAVRTMVNRIVTQGLSHPDEDLSVVIVGTDAAKPLTFNDGLISLSTIDTDKLGRFLADLKPAPGRLAPAITQALSTSPEQLIIITSQKLRAVDMGPIGDALGSRSSLIVDAVVLNTDSVDLQDLVVSRHGTYVRISSVRLEGWVLDAPPRRR